MTNKKMTDDEFRDVMLTSLSELHQEVMRFSVDLDVLKVAFILMSSKNGIDPEQLLNDAKYFQAMNALENSAEKGE